MTPLDLKTGEFSVAPVPATFTDGGVVVFTFNYGEKIQHIRLTLTNVKVTVVSGATSIGATVIARLPDQNFIVHNSEINMTVVKGGDFVVGDDLQISVGSATAASEALNGADANILPAQDKNDGAVAGFAVQASRIVSNTASYAQGSIIDSPTNDIFLNAACDDDGLAADGTLTFTGTLDIWLTPMGNVTS